MKRHSWNDIKGGISTRQPPGQMLDKDEFWSDFKARAKLRSQETPARNSRPLVLSWAVATACAVLLVAGIVKFQLTRSGDTVQHGSSVTSLDVMVPHSAVLIMNDEPDQGTIVWIVDMEMNGKNGDNV